MFSIQIIILFLVRVRHWVSGERLLLSRRGRVLGRPVPLRERPVPQLPGRLQVRVRHGVYEPRTGKRAVVHRHRRVSHVQQPLRFRPVRKLRRHVPLRVQRGIPGKNDFFKKRTIVPLTVHTSYALKTTAQRCAQSPIINIKR